MDSNHVNVLSDLTCTSYTPGDMTDVRKDDRNIPSDVAHLSGLSVLFSLQTDISSELCNDKSVSLDYFDISERHFDHSSSNQQIHDGQNDNSVTLDNPDLNISG